MEEAEAVVEGVVLEQVVHQPEPGSVQPQACLLPHRPRYQTTLQHSHQEEGLGLDQEEEEQGGSSHQVAPFPQQGCRVTGKSTSMAKLACRYWHCCLRDLHSPRRWRPRCQ